jgi:hypothetical protein
MLVEIGKYPKDPKQKRKIKINVNSDDTFSLDYTLSLIIYKSLEKFKEHRKKCPGVPYIFLPKGAKLGEETDAELKEGEKKFIEAIDKMIWSFKEIATSYPAEEDYWSKNKEGELKFDKIGLKRYSKKIEEGLILFGKHFQTLWR